jgi:hypothetical protein
MNIAPVGLVGNSWPVSRLAPLVALLCSVLLAASCFAQVEGADEQYFKIFQIIDQADTLKASGKPEPALAKYREAHNALIKFRQANPKANVQAVAYRLNYVDEQIAVMSQPAPPAISTQDSTGTKPGAPADSAPAAKRPAGPVKLLSAGSEPRKALRFQVKEGDKETLTITMKMSMGMGMGEMQNQEMKLPAMKMVLDSTVRAVSSEGDITYEMVMRETSVAEDGGAPPEVLNALKGPLTTMKGMSGTGTISSQGVVKSSNISLPSGGDPQSRQALEQMKELFSRLSTPFPDEPIGPGAKWELKSPIKAQGMNLDQTSTYELVSVEGDRVKTKGSINQKGANQKIENPAMPGLKLDLTKMTGTGTRELTQELGKLLPIAGTVSSVSDMAFAMDLGGQKQTLAMKLDMNLSLQGQ